jgi:hypothetical protein
MLAHHSDLYPLYLAYPLSYRQLEELMRERGVSVDHATINRWVLNYSSQLEAAFHSHKRPVWRRHALPHQGHSPSRCAEDDHDRWERGQRRGHPEL